MKRTTVLSIVLLALAGFATGLWYAWEPAPSRQETALEHAIKHMDDSYYCPMHPQVTSDQPQRCSICGMDLVPLASAAAAEQDEILFYRHPMDPTITSDKPQKDSMGMDYIPVYADETGGDGGITVAPEIVNNLGVRTVVVESRTLVRHIETVGYVEPDESLIGHVHLRTAGWVEDLTVATVGDRIKKGQRLFSLYSPVLVNAQEEYLQALARGGKKLIRAARQKLHALGVSEQQVQRLERTRQVERTVAVYSHHGGVVTELAVREGMYVEPATETITLVDLRRVWLQAEVFEQQAGWVAAGQRVEVRLPYLPGRAWQGVVDYIYPVLNPATRALKVRIRFDNPDELLKPNMFAGIRILAEPREDVTAVPREAVIRDGREERVIVALEGGRFAPRTVRTGLESGAWMEIIEGLKAGERVVTSAQFLLDSETSLKAGLQRMQSQTGTGESVP